MCGIISARHTKNVFFVFHAMSRILKIGCILSGPILSPAEPLRGRETLEFFIHQGQKLLGGVVLQGFGGRPEWWVMHHPDDWMIRYRTPPQ
jgi:hypothetical protein